MSTATAPVKGRCYNARLNLRNPVLTALLYLALAATTATAAPETETRFTIDAKQLSSALIQFSRQSGVPIVFASKLLQHLPAPPVTGRLSASQALDTLLNGTSLSWQLVDGQVFAVVEKRCLQAGTQGAGCLTPKQAVARYPAFTPGLEETYVYGTRVTGSRIRHTDAGYGAPVDVISGPDIELSGAQSIGELLKFVPAVVGNATSTAISNGGDGTATVTLRGLPASNTLVLIDGQRVANNGLAGDAVDLNAIAPAAVERIEILKDGASAVYGSDAIAGVVNIIMKRDFHGLLAESYLGTSERGDLETQTYTFQYGTGFADGSLFLSLSHYQQDPIYSRDRKVSRNADGRPQGGSDQRSSATPAARLMLADGTTLIAAKDGFRAATDEDRFNYLDFTTAVVPLERDSIDASLSYDLSEQVTTSLAVSYLQTDARATLAPTPVFTAFEQTPITLSADNRFNPFGIDLTDIRRRLVELQPREQQDQSEVTRVTATIEGLASDWEWNLGYRWSKSSARQTFRHIVNADHLQRALGPASDCQGPPQDECVAVNILGLPGSIEPEQVRYIETTGEVSGYSELSDLSANASHSISGLPAGEGDIAFGIAYREEETRKRPDRLLATTGTIGATNFKATRGDRSVVELYAETDVPLWQSTGGLSALNMNVALRYSNYSDFGRTSNPRVGLRLRTGPGLLLRASYAEGFRAPSLNELYEGRSEEQAFINDPCTVAANVGLLPGCTQLADPTRIQFLTIKGGNPKLSPEQAKSYSAGFVWTPTGAPGLVFSTDYFEIDQRDVISSSAQFVVSQNAREGQFKDSVQRDERGNLQQVVASNINIGARTVRGFDLALVYHHPAQAWGQLSLTGGATFIDDYLTRVDSTAPRQDIAGTFRDEASEGLGGIPRWKAQLGLRWRRGRWQSSYDLHYVSSMQEWIPGTERSRQIQDWSVHDLQLGYTFQVLDGLRWTLGVDNVLDRSAPFAASAFNDNIDGRTHELKGRYWYTRLSQRF